jgi:hypothetical protein
MDTQEHGATRPFGEAMGSVAGMLLGAPNGRLSSEGEIRYGRNGSLSIDLTSGTFYDHEAKQGGGVLDLIVREIGGDQKGAIEWLRKNGFLDEPAKPNGARQVPYRREVAHYDYTDENGDLVFQVVRYEPKTFVQRRKDRGRWVYQVKGVRQVPYRLPEVVEAIANERTVFIVEGEKDADNLAKWGIAATTNAGGSGKWHEEFSAFFHDADVVIVPDNDEAGRNHANQVAASLDGIASRVRLLALPGLPLKGDASDWIAAGGTPEAFHALVEQAPLFGKQIHSRFGGLRWEDIGHSLGVGYQWLVEDVVPLGEITLVYGDSGTGKSFDMFDMAMCVARGEPFNGRNVEPGLVVYVAAEAGKGFAKRKIAYSIQHKLDPAVSLPFYLCTKRPNFFHDDADAIALIEEIKAVAKSYNVPLRLIVIDTLSALAPGMNENASQDVSMVRKRLVMLQEQFEAAVILVHHKPKGGSTPRGHGSLTADFETTIEFETLSDLKTPEGKTIHQATVRKQREGKNGIAWRFTLPVVEVGKNRWGNPETSCVVHPLGENKSAYAAGFHATPAEKQFLHALYEALADHPQSPPAGLPKEIARVVHKSHVAEKMHSRYVSAEDDSERAKARFRQAFKRAADVLRDGAVIGVQGELFWPTGKPVNGFSSPKIGE